MAGPKSPHESHWHREAARVSRSVNLGWWLQTLAAPLVVIALAGAGGLLLVRRSRAELPLWQPAVAIGGILLVVGVVAWILARRRFETADSSMVRIEAAMELRNRLSAAKAGVAPWPPVPAGIDSGLSWNWRRVIAPPAAALAFLLAGFLLPVTAVSRSTDPPEEPLAWREMEVDLERLGEDEVMDEAYLDEMKKKLEELRAQEEEEWFSHSSLEATDSLKRQHESEMQRVDRELGRADRALGNLAKNSSNLSQARKDQLINQFDQALEGLRNGALKPNPDLLEQLQQLNPGNLGQLGDEQLRQLRDNLRKARQAAGSGGGQGNEGQPGDDWLDELLDGQGDGECQGGHCSGCGDPNCPNGTQPGKGAVNRGPGHAPGVLGKQGERFDTGDLETLEAKDLSRSLPGDLLQLQDGEHQVDRSATSSQQGGAVGSAGAGGDRVWKESLDPDEQRALKRFFE